MEKIKDKVAFITGGSKGIGFGIASALIDLGVHVVITSRKAAEVESAAEQLNRRNGGRALGLVADVCSKNSLIGAVSQTHKTFGTIDFAIANAGMGHYESIETISDENWHKTIDTNLTGVFYTVKSLLDDLKKSRGYLIVIASMQGLYFQAGSAAYNASKFGVVGFSQAIMQDLRPLGIRVTTICPGSVASHFNGHTPNKEDAWKIQPEDLGELITDLLRMNRRVLPGKIELRPAMPPKK